MEQFKDLVSLAPWDFVFQLGNLLILTLLVKHFLFVPVQKVIEQRQQQSNQLLEQARESQQKADQAKADCESRLAGADRRAQEIVEQAQRTAQAQAQELVQNARQEAVRMKQQASSEIERQRIQALTSAKQEIGGMAVEIAGKVVEKELDASVHQQLIDEFIEKVGDAS
ncbi:F0F1 ATP synthase subunit B [uncultured Allofournierella sp.]|uniref:F0F1 ATP synthase subunit B n=1 Tax=uncultured Allofournierella sp. TaxID=1940258 RepID=UPI0037502A43